MGKKVKLILSVVLYIGVLLAGLRLIPAGIAYANAASPVRVYAVEYYEEQLQVYNNGNSKIYYATELDASKNNWEIIDAEADGITMIDISWLSSATDNILVVRGDMDATQSRIIIKKKPLKLSVTIDYTNMKLLDKNSTIASLVNIMTDVGTGANPVTFADLEWRKGTTGQWKPTSLLTVGLMEKFLVNGTTLYFRIKALDDVHTPGSSTYPDGTKGRRFSGEVKVKVPKQAPVAAYSVDGGKCTVDIKYGKEYRISVAGGAFSDWVQVTDKSARFLTLSNMLKATKNNPADKIGLLEGYPFPQMTVEIRDYASSKAPASKIGSLSIDAQRVLPQSRLRVNEDVSNNENIYVSYSGNKYLLIRIPSASASNPYEYCVVKKGESLNLEKAAWTAITKGTEVKVPSNKAEDGGTLYIRMKEIKPKTDASKKAISNIILASTYVSHEIRYPTMPVVAKGSYTFIKDFSGDISFEVNLGKEPFETQIDNIKLGTWDIGFTTTSKTSGENKILEVTLKKESLNSLPNGNNKYIYIYFSKGTVDKTSVKLTIQNTVKAADLTVSTAKGSDNGTLAFTMVSSKGAGNSWSYIIGNDLIDKVYTQHKIADLTTIAPVSFTTTKVDNISASAGQYLTIFETDKNGYIIKFKCIKITSDMIK